MYNNDKVQNCTDVFINEEEKNMYEKTFENGFTPPPNEGIKNSSERDSGTDEQKNNITSIDRKDCNTNTRRQQAKNYSNLDDVKVEVKRISATDLVNHGILQPARKSGGFVCPFCGNGTGEDGTGVDFKGEEHPDGTFGYHCFKCDEKFDNISILAEVWGLDQRQRDDFIEIMNRAANKFNISGLNISSNKNHSRRTPTTAATPAKKQFNLKADTKDSEELKLIRDDVVNSQKNLSAFVESQGGKYRGLTLETLQHFHCGYIHDWFSPKKRLEYETKCKALDEKFKNAPPDFARNLKESHLPKIEKTPRLIIPTSERHYLARFVGEQGGNGYEKMHAGNKEIFGLEFLPADAELIVLVEGEIDVMSIYQATEGEIPALAFGGATSFDALLPDLYEKISPTTRILILFDSDDTGRKNAEKLKAELTNRGYIAVEKFFLPLTKSVGEDGEEPRIIEKNFDANDLLINVGDDYLKAEIENLIEGAEEDFQAAEKNLEKVLSDDLKKKIFSDGNTDLDNAKKLNAMFGDKICFVPELDSWGLYDGGIWKFDSPGKNTSVLNLSIDAAERIAASAFSDDEKKIAKRFQQQRKLSASLYFLRAFDNILISEKDFDNHPELLPVKNGIIDLTTGKLMNHDANLYFTKQCPVIYNPLVKPKKFEKFMSEIVPDEETRRAVLRFLGYCLTGDIRAEKALFIVGDGRNGKGTLIKVLMAILDDYATPLKIDSLLLRKYDKDGDAPTPEFAKLEGRRVAIANEIPQGRTLDVAHFKDLTGGDKIAIRHLHKPSSTIENPTFKLILCGQHFPELQDANDIGLRERLLPVIFPNSFVGVKCNENMKKELTQPDELTGILNLLVGESIKYFRDGLIMSDAMKKERDDYLESNNFIKMFIDENCEFGADKFCRLQDLVNALRHNYSRETQSSSEKALRAMLQRAFEKKADVRKERKKGGYIFYGVGLINEVQGNLAMSDVEN